jgi:hypothetical protein
MLNPLTNTGAAANGFTGTKNASVNCSLGFSSAPTDKNLDNWGQHTVRIVLENCSRTYTQYWYEPVSMYWCGELIPNVCPSILDTPCIVTIVFQIIKRLCNKTLLLTNLHKTSVMCGPSLRRALLYFSENSRYFAIQGPRCLNFSYP